MIDIEHMQRCISELRRNLADADPAGLDGLAETEVFTAVFHLDLAICALEKAEIHQARALAQLPFRP